MKSNSDTSQKDKKRERDRSEGILKVYRELGLEFPEARERFLRMANLGEVPVEREELGTSLVTRSNAAGEETDSNA